MLRNEWFISGKLWKSRSSTRGYARPVLLVSLISTTLGVFVMLSSAFIARGFQKEIRSKVTGFGAHLQIVPFGTGTSDEGEPLRVPQPYTVNFRSTFPFARSIYPFAVKTGILQARQKDERGNRELQGVMCQGISPGFDAGFLRSFMEKGRIPSTTHAGKPGNEILISRSIANRLQCNMGDTVYLTLVSREKDGAIAPRLHKLAVSGIYRTGLEDMDSRFVYIDLGVIQYSNAWGLEISPSFTPYDDEHTLVKFTGRGGTGIYHFVEPGGSLQPDSFLVKHAYTQGTIVLADENYRDDPMYEDISWTYPDTLSFIITTRADFTPPSPQWQPFTSYAAGKTNVQVWLSQAEPTYRMYATGYAVVLDNLSDLEMASKKISRVLPPEQGIRTVVEEYENIFNWLELIETNVLVIILLMIVVAIVNMISAILVLILERARFIGLMKTLGSTHGLLRRIFMVLSFRQLLMGIVAGNCLALLLMFIQQQSGFLTLNPETYFVDTVPLVFDYSSWITINLVTLASCIIAVLLPTWLISRIRPVKALRMQ